MIASRQLTLRVDGVDVPIADNPDLELRRAWSFIVDGQPLPPCPTRRTPPRWRLWRRAILRAARASAPMLRPIARRVVVDVFHGDRRRRRRREDYVSEVLAALDGFAWSRRPDVVVRTHLDRDQPRVEVNILEEAA